MRQDSWKKELTVDMLFLFVILEDAVIFPILYGVGSEF